MTITLLCRISFGLTLFVIYTLWIAIFIDAGYWPIAVLMAPWFPLVHALADRRFIKTFGDGL